MRYKILIIVFLTYHSSSSCFAQTEVLDFTDNILWDVSASRDKANINRIGIDTIKGDTLLIMSETYIRLDNKGDTLEILEFKDCLWDKQCSGDGYNFSGRYKEFYNSGKIKRLGNVICNRKAGEWIGFYESGSIKSYENFETYELTLGHATPYQSGVHMEYFSNGKIKTSGSFLVVQKLSNYPILNISTNELENKCCKWVTNSVKTGTWREYDKQGNVLNQKEYQFDYDTSKIYRKLSAKYINED